MDRYRISNTIFFSTSTVVIFYLFCNPIKNFKKIKKHFHSIFNLSLTSFKYLKFNGVFTKLSVNTLELKT